jgi:hypothetical protein
LHGKGGVRHAATNWVKQYDASTMCRPLESTAVRLATGRQGTSLGNAIETRWWTEQQPQHPVIATRVVVYKLHKLGDASVVSWKLLAVG